MAKVAANELRAGMLIEHNSSLWRVISSTHIQVSGRGGAGMQVEMRAVDSGSKLSHRFRTDEKIKRPFVATHTMQYLYRDGDDHIFMDTQTFEQTTVSATVLDEAANYLLPNLQVVLNEIDGRMLSIELPTQVELEVTATEPYIKGATATSSFKPANTTTGFTVMVPPFIKTGETIRVNTTTGAYVGRASS